VDECEELKAMVREYMEWGCLYDNMGQCETCNYRPGGKQPDHNDYCLYRRIREAVGLDAPAYTPPTQEDW
jgi:hypothetical protein